MSTNTKHAIDAIRAAERSGMGGKERDCLERAILLLAEDYFYSHDAAGNEASDAANILKDGLDRIVHHNTTSRDW